jgi:HSP20 family molecular chaperone IbpA
MTQTATRPANNQTEVFFTPRVDILEGSDEWTVFADMPGVKADDVDIQYNRGELTVRGKHRAANPRPYLLHGYEVGDYFRTFQVGENIDPEKIHAELRLGVLIIHLPKSESLKPRKIEVRAGD